MKRTLVLGGLLLMGSVAPSQTAAGWKTLLSRDGHFSIRMPAAAQETLVPSHEEGGTVRQYFYQARAPYGNDYVVSCWDYTDAPRRHLDLSDLDDAATVQRGELARPSTPVKKLLLGRVPGREFRTARPDGKTDYFRFYLTGRRLYSISVAANGRQNTPEESRAFLDSFRLLP